MVCFYGFIYSSATKISLNVPCNGWALDFPCNLGKFPTRIRVVLYSLRNNFITLNKGVIII